MKDVMEKAITLQSKKLLEQIDISLFIEGMLNSLKEGHMDLKRFKKLIENVEIEYLDFIVELSTKMVEEKIIELIEELASEKELEKVEDLNELEEVSDDEIEPLEKEENETDLEYVIRNDIYMKNVKIEQTIKKYPEEQTENYWMIGLDINNCSEEELQKLSIFEQEFW